MIKVYLPPRALSGIGGGWTFTRNIQKALRGSIEFSHELNDCDIYFIPGLTLAERQEVLRAKELGKKIVLRVDNIPRNSRNRNTGTSRLYDFAKLADVVIYQSEWAKRWIMPFIKKDGPVILNGADTEIFKPEGEKISREGDPQFLYSRVSTNETKRWEKAWYDFQRIYFKNPNAHLWIVGKFSPQQIEYKFDFFGGAEKRYRYFGIIENPEEMAKIYRSADYLLYPYYLEACSNTLIEAKLCGLEILYSGDDDESSALEILRASRQDLTLEAMGKKYLEVFKKLCLTTENN